MSDSIYARPKGVHLSDEEMSRVMGAETGAMRSPIPTQIISNGEYNPPPQTEKQKQVEGVINEYADKYGRKMGMDRRKFLTTSCGMAAAFLAMNKVYGPVFDVSEAEAADREMSDERAKLLSKQFIFDDQTHFVRDEFDKKGRRFGRLCVEELESGDDRREKRRRAAHARSLQVPELYEGNLPRQRHQSCAAFRRAIR